MRNESIETSNTANTVETLKPVDSKAGEANFVNTGELAKEALAAEESLKMETEADKELSGKQYANIAGEINKLKTPEAPKMTPDAIVANMRAKEKAVVETYEADQKEKQSKRSLVGKVWNFMISQDGATTDKEVAKQGYIRRTKIELKTNDYLKSKNLSDVAVMKLMDSADGVGTKYKATEGRIKNVISMLRAEGLEGDALKEAAHTVAAEYDATNIDGPEFEGLKKEAASMLEEKQRFQNSQNVPL